MGDVFISEWVKSRGENIEEWAEKKKSILFAAPTGAGKTIFTIECIAKKCYEKHWKMALFVNRNSLKEQVNYKVQEFVFENCVRNNPIYVFTYQELESSRERREYILECLEECSYVVLDEVHYFASDSIFSPETEVSFMELVNFIGKKCLVMMSATSGGFQGILDFYLKGLNEENRRRWEESCQIYTDEYVYGRPSCKMGLVEIMEAEEEYAIREFEDYMYLEPDSKPEVLEYEVMEVGQPDYSYVNLNYYDTPEELANVIVDSNKKEKWLVFVNSCNEGRSMKENIISVFKRNDDIRTVEFVSSKPSESKALEYVVDEIASKENLPVSILITTSVLDNGVTIKDSKLKNIAIAAFDECEFKQMLGRRRINEGDEIQLYVSKGSVSYFKKQKKRVFDEFRYVFPVLGKKPFDIETAILRRRVAWENIEHYVYNDDGSLKFGWLSYRQHSLQFGELKKLVNEMENNPQYYARQVCKWLGKDYDTEANIYRGMTEEKLCKYALDELDKMDFIISHDKLSAFTWRIEEFTGDKLNADVDSVNEFLAKHTLTNDYQLEAVQLNKSKYYFVIVGGENPCRILDQISNMEQLQELLQERPMDDANDLYYMLFGRDIPECVSEEIYSQFISACLKKNTGFEEVALRKGKQGYQLYGGKKNEQKIAES